jgi:GntR family transcriptional repressor for pyruvate dehydrogenase complex
MFDNSIDEKNILDKINEAAVRSENKEDYKYMVNQILYFINSGDLQPGQLLPGERFLAEAFNSGRTNVRIALKMLEFFGIIESKAGKGNYITDKPENLSFINMIDLYDIVSNNPFKDVAEARIALEPQMAALAALNRDENDLKAMREALMKQESNDNIIDTADAFHCAIFRACKNNILIKISVMLHELMNESRKMSLSLPNRNPSSVEEHRRIYKAIENRNSEDAAKYMLEHLNIIKRNILQNAHVMEDSELKEE